MKRGKICIRILLTVVLMINLMPLGVRAAASVTTDKIADFTDEDGGAAALALLTGGEETLASWDQEQKVLTLSGVNFTTTAPVGVMLPEGSTVVLTSGTENRISSNCLIKEGYSCGIACGELEQIWYEMSNERGYSIYLNGDLTIKGQGTLCAQGGNINAANKGYYSMGIGAHRLFILNGTITAKGGVAENGAYSEGIYTSYIRRDGEIENGDISIAGGKVTASGETTGIHASLGTLFISGDADVSASGGVSATVLDVSGGRLTAEGSFGVSASLNITGGTVTVSGTSVGIGNSSAASTISGGTVRVTGGDLGACLFDSGRVSITGGELYCDGSFWCYALSVTGGRMEVKATEDMPALGLTCQSKAYFEPEELCAPQIGLGMKLSCGSGDGQYQAGAVTERYEYDFYQNHGAYIKAYTAVFDADGSAPATSILISPMNASDVEEQIGVLGDDSTVETVNQTAVLYTNLTAEERAAVSVDHVQTLDELVQSKNQLEVTKELPDGMTVSGLALASGVFQDSSVRSMELTVTDVTDTAQGEVAEALQELCFTMAVNDRAAQPVVPVVVNLPYTQAMKEQGASLKVIHLTEDGRREKVPYTISEDESTLIFRAASFSGYAVVGDPANASVDVLSLISAYRVQTPKDVPEHCTLVVASYDVDGRMKEVHWYSNVEENEIRLLTWRVEPTECRAFLLNGQWGPQEAAARWTGQ